MPQHERRHGEIAPLNAYPRAIPRHIPANDDHSPVLAELPIMLQCMKNIPAVPSRANAPIMARIMIIVLPSVEFMVIFICFVIANYAGK